VLLNSLKSNNAKKALQELQNMRQNMYMVNNEISPRYLAFAALIHSIDGKDFGECILSIIISMASICSELSVSFIIEPNTRSVHNAVDNIKQQLEAESKSVKRHKRK